MKRLTKNVATGLVILAGFFTSARAQQRPLYTQYVLNPFISNPALAGVEDNWNIKASYRNQWLGLKGAPQTTYLTAHGPLRKSFSDTATPSMSMRNVPSKGRFKTTIPHAGLGFVLLNDRHGPVDWYAVNVAYAYHLPLSRTTSLSAGISTGIQGINIHLDQFYFGPVNPDDPAIGSDNLVNKVKPDINLGVWLYSAFYFIGISSQHILPLKINYSADHHSTAHGSLVPHYSFIGGYKFFLHENVNFLPSVMVRYVHNTPLNFDVNTKFQYRDIAWLGVSYRYSNNFAAILGMNINTSLSLSYSYDITSSSLKSASQGTHEVVIGMLLRTNKRVVLSPRNFW